MRLTRHPWIARSRSVRSAWRSLLPALQQILRLECRRADDNRAHSLDTRVTGFINIGYVFVVWRVRKNR